MLNNLNNAVKATNLCAPIQAFERSKAPIWGIFDMSNHQKGHSDVGASLNQFLQRRYCIMQFFLFCPVQLSAWRNTSCSCIHAVINFFLGTHIHRYKCFFLTHTYRIHFKLINCCFHIIIIKTCHCHLYVL